MSRSSVLSVLRKTRQSYSQFWGRYKCIKSCLQARLLSSTNATNCMNSEVADPSPPLHIPVMKEQVLDILKPRDQQVILDMTFGAGGHTKSLLEEEPGAKIYCLDRDPLAYEEAKYLACERSNIVPILGRFSSVHQLLSQYGVGANSLDSVLFDVGASSMQFDDPGRGFSLSQDGPLDMRMDRGSTDQMTAEDVVNSLSENELYKIFKYYGEEKAARLIAQAVLDSRCAFGRIQTTQQLANIVSSVFEIQSRQDKLHRHSHVATKVFQALRIFVNNELNELYNGLVIAHHLLKPGGTCAVISFHSLEDRIVKRQFKGIDMDAKLGMSITDQHRVGKKLYKAEDMAEVQHSDWEVIGKGALLPTEEEVANNPRARSAKLRAARKV